MQRSNFYVYITTNPQKTVLYIGVTNDLAKRMEEHAKANVNSFVGKYFCYNLIYYEHFRSVNEAIAREKQLKKWSRFKKENLINTMNPTWKVLKIED